MSGNDPIKYTKVKNGYRLNKLKAKKFDGISVTLVNKKTKDTKWVYAMWSWS